MIKSRKIKYILMSVLAVIMSVCTIFAVFGVPEFAHTADAATNVGRVEFIDLYKRYPTDYVIGPVDVDSSDVNPVTGKYTYKATNKDINGNPTNNIYGIPAEQYFNVENYIYTEEDPDDDNGGRILRGWKPDIRKVTGSGSAKGKIAENGKIMEGETVTDNTGIFVTFPDSQLFGTTVRYALIVPDYVTRVGTGSAAYVYGSKSYYNNNTTGTEDGAEFTDFGCFIFEGIKTNSEPYFWQPRERLAGVYFTGNSRLKTIDGATYSYSTPSTAWNNSRTDTRKAGKGAFEYCDNLRYLILPTGLTSIGKSAFYKCSLIVDMNIPTSVNTIGAYAFQGCTSVGILPRPTGTNIDGTAFDGVTNKTSGENFYILGGAPTYENGKKVLDNGTFLFESGSPWQAVGLTGETGEDPNKVFIFPNSSDFNENSDRRKGVPYDYIDRNGNKMKNDFPSGGVTSYKIADNFASGVWCKNVILPEAVTEIGSNAFYNSGVKYLETYATKIGKDAFTGLNNKANSEQWYYFHWTGNETTSSYSIPNDAFITPNGTRHIVFENKAMKDNVGSTFTGLSNLAPSGTVVHYQIPVYAHVYSEDAETIDGEGISLKYSDMDDHFFDDYDYKDYLESRYLKQGDNTIVYTKKLSGYPFTSTKLATGGWSASEVVDSSLLSNPTLSHMEIKQEDKQKGKVATVWYSGVTNTGNSAAYTSQTTASALFNSSTSTRVDIYTKKIKKAENIKNKTYIQDYEFGKEYVGVGKLSDTDSIGYYAALNLSETDYKITLTDFTFPDERTKWTASTTALQNAGDYSFDIQIAEKWGKWSDEYIGLDTEYFTASVKIARQQIDFTDITKFEFSNANNDGWKLHGNANPLYRYFDGWYLAQQADKVELDSRAAVTNAISYGGNGVTWIKLAGEKITNANDSTSQYMGAEIISRNGLDGTMSGEYTANFIFQVKFIENSGGQSNYEFKYSSQFNESDENRGLTMTGKNQFTFRLSKQWYIVKETNLFIIEGSREGSSNGTPYSPLAEGTEITYGNNLTLRQPELNFGGTAVKIEFEIDYTTVGGSTVKVKARTALDRTGSNQENTLAYYINKYMPAGVYSIKLYGDAVDVLDGTNNKHYDEISGEYVITVAAKTLVTDAFDSAIATGGDKNEENIGTDVYSWPYGGDHNSLYGSVTEDAEDELNSVLADELTAVKASGTYWADKTQYYSSEITVSYNLDRWGNTNYLDSTSIPANADNYTVYYSVSARNYKTHGGEGDDNRRDKKFTVIIYNSISVKQNLLQSEIFANAIYFRDVMYTGDTVQTLVPYNQHFSYAFNDEDYINARNNATVTLTLNNPALAKWKVDVEGDVAARFVVSDDKTTVTAYFNILPADNRWDVTPSISGWTYNGFDSDVHVVSSKLAFEDTRAYYRLSLNRNGGNWVSLGANDYFEVDSNGRVTDSDVINALKTLKPDSYYLFGFADGYEDGNVKEFDPYSSSLANPANGVLVVIGKAINRWTTSPDIIRWYWSEYNKTVNTISGVALYLNVEELTGRTIKYAILDADNNVVDGLYGITVENGVIVDDENDTIANKIKNLGVGTYYLLATVEESDYYTGINEYVLSGVKMTAKNTGETLDRTSFVISQFVNKWNTTSPSMTSWEYKAFAASNFVAGDPVFGNASDIVYTVSGGSLATPITFTGELTEDAIKALTALAVNSSYKLTAKLANTDDYSELTYETTFSVTKVNNRWTTTPGMTGWAYKAFASGNFRAGEPALHEVEDVQVEYKLSLNKDNAAIIATFTNVNDYSFVNLAVGNYKIVATFAGTDNYNPLEQEITFAVTQVNNRWTITPGMTGWAYKAFTAGNFRAGEPALNEVEGVEVVYVLSLNKDNAATMATFTNVSEYDFENLAVGSYKIIATFAGTDNYNALEQEITFTVSQVANSWQTSPSMPSWSYNAFANNFRTGVPAFGNASDIKYTVSGGSLATPIEFVFDEDGTLSKNTKDALNALPVFGEYIISAFLKGNTEYGDLTYSATFGVNIINNTWSTTPVLTGWAYNSFAESNFTAGIPALNEADENGQYKSVVYKLSKRNASNVYVEFGFDFDVNDLMALNSLERGDYMLTVTFDGNNNYNGLNQPIYFSVTQATVNNWQTRVSVESWTYNSAPETIAAGGSSTFGTETATYTIMKGADTVATFNSIAELNAYRGNLRAGNYVLGVSIAATDNYVGLTDTLSFVVSKADNEWTDGVYPTLTKTEWTYGETAGGLKPVSVVYTDDGAIVISQNYYNAVLRNGTWAADLNAPVDEPVNAGTYMLVTTADYSDESEVEPTFNPLTHETLVTISLFSNDWKDGCAPENSLVWTWGAHENMESSRLVKAEAQMHAENGEVTYRIEATDGREYVPQTKTGSEIVEFLRSLPVGEYEITVTSAGDINNNYSGVTTSTDITVNPASLEWTIAPADAAWTWGVADADKNFVMPEVNVVKGDDKGKVKFGFTVTNKDGASNTYDNETLFNGIKDRDAGSYTVDISVTCANYNTLTATVTLTVNQAQFSWNVADNATLNTSWDWGAENKPLIELIAYDKDNEIVDGATEFQYRIGNTAYTKEVGKSAFDQLKDALYTGAHSTAGTYTVTVTASRTNYTTSTKTFTVTINEVQNKWTNEFTKYIEKTYQSNITSGELVLATALRGNAVYFYNNQQYVEAALITLINGFPVGEHKITVSVAAADKMYTGLTETLTVKVNGIGSQWDNIGSLKHVYDGFNYSGLTESMKSVVIPTITIGEGKGNVSYTVYYAAVGAEITNETPSAFSNNNSSVSALRAWLENADRNAGTYKIVSRYNPQDGGYSPLDYEITINVALCEDEWETTLGARYEGTFSSELDIPDPTASRAVTVTVTNASGNDCGYTSGSLKEFFKTRDVGRYTVTYSVAAVANQYTGLTARTAEVNITIAVNAWNAGTEFTDITVYRGDAFNITVPGALHGDTHVSFAGTPIDITQTDLNVWLNSDLHYPEANTYRIDFSVTGTANYTGVNGSYIITVAKRDISWVKAPHNYTWTGEVTLSEFETPTYKLDSESEETSELVRFDVTKSGTNVTNTYNAEKFAEELAKFVNGTYTVVVRVGSNGLGETDSAILAYNKDYNVLSENILITVTRATNGWTTALEDLDWTYEETPTVVKPVATHGNDNIVYTIRGTGDTDYEEKTFDFNEPNANFTNFMNEVKALGAGSYVATATIDQTNIYGSETCSAIITVRQFVTAWTAGNTQSDFNWIYEREVGSGEGKNQIIPELTVNHGTVKYYLEGSESPLTNDPETVVDESKPNGYLFNKPVGVYVIIAKAGGENTNYASIEFRITVNIAKADNTWNQEIADGETWTYNSLPADLNFVAAKNVVPMQIRINNELKERDLRTELADLNAGSYTLTVTVPTSDNYNELTKTISITVEKIKDGWTDGTSLAVAGWTWDNGNLAFAMNGNDIKADGVNSEAKITWSLPVPKFAAQISVAVAKPGMDTINLTVLKVDGKLDISGLESLHTRLRSLGTGTYTVTVSVAERDNYSGYSEDAEFTVVKATNAWNAGGKPSIIGWNFGGDKAIPTATPKYGRPIDVEYKYVSFANVTIPENATREQLLKIAEELPESAWDENQPSTQGRHFLRGYLAGTDDYEEIYGYNIFEINAGHNEFTVTPGVIEWSWDNYVKGTNLFVGTASHQKSISFEIFKGTANNYSTLTGSDFVKSDGSGITAEELELITGTIKYEGDTNLVSDRIAQILKALKPTPVDNSYSYWLRAEAQGEEGYETIFMYSSFKVSKASNGWVTPTALASFTYDGTILFTAGTATYGTEYIKYSITGATIQTISDLSADEVVGELRGLNAGNYILHFSIADDASTQYLGINERIIEFIVSPAQNTWVTPPSAQINATYSDIQAMYEDEELKELKKWYPELEPIDGEKGNVVYELRGSSSSIKDDLSYSKLLDEIRNLKEGEYIIRASFAGTTNYTAISATDTRVVISKYENGFTAIPEALTAQWYQDSDGNNATELEDFTVTAVHGTVKYTLNKNEYIGYNAFKEAVKELDAKSYTVLISVEPTDGYAGLEITRVLTVNPGENFWKDGWTKENSLKLSGNVRSTWIWDNTIEWVGPVPEYGDTIEVVIRVKGQTSAVLYRTINVNSLFASSVADIGSAISKLDEGTYEIEVIAPESSNWQRLSDIHEFTITTKTNGWPTAPQLTGATNNITKWTWTYGNTVLTRAVSQYGEVEIKYYDKDGNKLSDMPVDVGEYSIKFIVPRPDSNNYTGLERTLDCEIVKATNEAFNVYPSAIGWRWHEYDRLTNLFAGDPVTGGAITYSVYKGETAIVKNIALVNAEGVHTGKPANDLYVPVKMTDPETMEEIKVAEILAELLAGTYTLRVDVGETDNFNGFHAEAQLIVSYNRNEWTTTPQVVPWSVNNWKAADHTPQAKSLFGNPTIIIRSRIGSVDYYKAVYNPETGEYDVENTLNRGEIGWYDLIATVPAAEGMYENALETTVPFQIFVQGSPDEKNYWLNSPSISGWTANTEGKFNMPVAKAARGLSYFVFYKAIWNGSSYVKGEQVTKDDKWVIKVDQEDKYYTDWYVPVENGHYFMEARAISGSGLNDNITDEPPILFEIYYRPNSFTEEPRIATLLYLGSRDYWENPTAAAALENSEIKYTYRNIETGEDLGEEMPKTEGRFMLRATASALFSEDIYRDVEFRVELSYNGWLSSPIIDDWSEEFDPNAPTGEALIGSENIKYQYATKDDPKNYFDEKPTAEGEYILHATLEIEGYVPLEHDHPFTIEPAFDKDLLVVDIILGVVGCALAVTVIVFAIRRYKEN